jgi:hypothetical protein
MKARLIKKIVFVFLPILVLAGFFSPKITKADDDDTPPQLLSFALDKTEINTDSGSDTITMTVHVTDDNSGLCVMDDDCGGGITYMQAQISPFNGTNFGTQTAWFLDFSRTGTPQDGVYEATATFPQGSANGEWRIRNLFMSDMLGNVSSLDMDDLISDFGANAISVENAALSSESEPPELLSVALDKTEIDTDSGSDSIKMTVHITDDISGLCIMSDNCGGFVSYLQAAISPYNGTSFGTQNSAFLQFTRTGTPQDGVYEATATFPQGSANGEWRIQTLSMSDMLGNNTSFSMEQLASSFGASAISFDNVAITSETVPPQLLSFSLDKTEIDTDSGSDSIKMTVHITDDISGLCIMSDNCGGNITYMQARAKPLIGTQSIDFLTFSRTGTALDGVYEATATIPRYSKEGIWQIEYIYTSDMMGNSRVYYTNDISSITGGSGATFLNMAQSDSVEIESEWKFESEKVSVTFPAGTMVTREEGGSFAFYQMVNQDFSLGDVTTNGLDPTDTSNIVGKIKIGIPGLGLSFSKPVTLEFSVGSQYDGQVLEIQTLGESGSSWANETTCTVSNGKCSFTVNHASYFAAIKTTASGTANGTVTGSTNGSIVIGTDTPTLAYSTSKKAKRKINLTFNGLGMTKKKWVKIRLNGRKVTVQRVKRIGDDTFVRIYIKYKKWGVGNYGLSMTYKNQIKVPYTTKKGKTKYRKGWESGGITSENMLSII